MQTIIWNGCYDSSWARFITPESFAHPAKFARGLIERIFDHCLECGYLQPGDEVGDCFGGVGCGGVIAAYRKLRWTGAELEPRFVKLAQDNFALHAYRLDRLNAPMPRIIQGDSRAFHVLLAGDTAAVVASPPYAETGGNGGGGINVNGYVPAPGRKWTGEKPDPVGSRTYQGRANDRIEGNIECLKSGTVEAVVTSPPFRDARSDTEKSHPTKHGGPCADRHATTQAGAGYGDTEGQIDNLSTGSVTAVVTSPPYSEGLGHGGGDAPIPHDTNGTAQSMRDGYGESPGQIGKEHGETYWQAMDAVYRSCFQAIRPGGIIVLVVKDYVAKRQRVPLCDDTARLLEHIGFTPLERIHAMLTKTFRHADMFVGTSAHTKSRKSFFRRMAEKKGSPAIDYEEVLIFRKP